MAIFGIKTKKDRELEQLREENEQIKKAISMSDPTLASIFRWRIKGEDEALNTPDTQVPIIYACIRARAMNLRRCRYRFTGATPK